MTYYALDCSMYEGQDWLRTADSHIALYPSKQEALIAQSVLGGTVVPFIGHKPRPGFSKVV